MPTKTGVKAFVSSLSAKQIEDLTRKLKKKRKQAGVHFGPASARRVAPTVTAPSVLESVSPVKTRREALREYTDRLGIALSEKGRLPEKAVLAKDPGAWKAFEDLRPASEYFSDPKTPNPTKKAEEALLITPVNESPIAKLFAKSTARKRGKAAAAAAAEKAAEKATEKNTETKSEVDIGPIAKAPAEKRNPGVTGFGFTVSILKKKKRT